ncbi:MAG: glycosyltransferase family 39 protein, partial [Nitriliruptorales bacterium]
MLGERVLGERVPRAVWALTAFHIALLLGASLLFPAFRPPDEAGHVDLVLHARRTLAWPDYDEAQMSVPVVAARERVQPGGIQIARPPRHTVEDATARGDRPTFGDLGGAAEAMPRGTRATFDHLAEERGWAAAGEPNQLANHPPLYYYVTGAVSAVLSAVVEVFAGPLDFLQSVWLMRLVSVAMVAPLPFLAWATARRIGAPPVAAVAAAAVPLAIPQLTHIGAAVNNDNLLTLAFGVLTLLLVAVWDGDVRPRLAVVVGAVGAVSLLAKGFALVLPPWIAAAYLA